MADITLTCTHCGNIITVSEFVSAEFLICMKCKSQVPIPQRQADAVPVSAKLKFPTPPPEPVPAPSGRTTPKLARVSGLNHEVQQFMPKGKSRIKRRKASNFEVKVLPWLLFVLLAAGLAWVRFWPEALAPDLLKTTIQGGVWALLILHLSVASCAFSDEAFYGVLCLLIPGYSIYYLFFQSDQMVLRAVAGALLIAFGWDATLATRELWAEVYTTVSIWIATTDTVKK